MIFVDTGAFVARYVARDQYHAKAASFWRDLESRREHCLTSNLVLSETLTLLARRAGYAFASDRARHLLFSSFLTILRPGHEHEAAAIDLFEKFADQRVSFTDSVSFVLMKEHRVSRAFSFDRHFEQAGFRLCP